MRNLLIVMIFCFSLTGHQIHVVLTSALISNEFDLRKEEYVNCVNRWKSYEFEPWIIEATNISSSFFDALSPQVLYPQVHKSPLRNKGVNEISSFRASLPYLPFEDDDIVIKMTGRYLLQSPSFLNTIRETLDEYDVWGVFGKHFNEKNDLFTGCFAMRWKHLKQIIEEMDLERAEQECVAIEILFGQWIKNQKLRVNALDCLHVRARIFICEENYYEF